MTLKNEVKMSFTSCSENVGIARLTAAAFAAQVDMTVNELEEIKVAISEAISNSVIHGYSNQPGMIEFTLQLFDDRLVFTVEDLGKGIQDVALARRPSFTTDPERMGLGFVFMESFMDELFVESELGRGTKVVMIKHVNPTPEH